MKRLLTLLFSGAMLLSFAACGETEQPTDTDSQPVSSEVFSVSDTDTSTTDTDTSTTDTEQKDTSEKEDVKAKVFDTSLDHKLIMDDSSKRILVVDLDKGNSPEEWSMENAVIWEWSVDEAKGASFYGKDVRIDSTKYRYSSYYKKDVIVFCGSAGWVGIIDYETKEVLFDHKPGQGPHSVELLPNGDLVVACSGNDGAAEGRVLYYPLSSGSSAPSPKPIMLNSAHGVCYDPQNEVVWALGSTEVIALKPVGSGKDAKLMQIAGMGASLGVTGGHVMTPAFGNPGKYWLSSSQQTWIFDANEGTVSSTDLKCDEYSNKGVKGMAYFADGTMVQTAHDQGGTGTYRSSELKIMYLAESSGKVTQAVVKSVMIPHRVGSQTYKVHVFTKDYQ